MVNKLPNNAAAAHHAGFWAGRCPGWAQAGSGAALLGSAGQFGLAGEAGLDLQIGQALVNIDGRVHGV